MKSDPKKFDWSFVGLDFGNWEDEKLWALDIPISDMDVKELEWHFDCPFWVHDNGERYTVTPREVLGQVDGTKDEQKAVHSADTRYPIEVYFNKDKWLILDGLHRLVKLCLQGAKSARVRIITEKNLSTILSGEPIEMPSWYTSS